jgi:hypothetical protein
MSQLACFFQNIGLQFSVNFICTARFIIFDLFIVAYPGVLKIPLGTQSSTERWMNFRLAFYLKYLAAMWLS